jgi:Ras-related GTP-binding protein C/D
LSEKGNGDVLVSYYLTSIYDHSALEAFSKVDIIPSFTFSHVPGCSKISPSTPNSQQSPRCFDRLVSFILMILIYFSCNVEKSFIVDVVTKLYIATDSTPVDAHTYELCSDLLDVVMDISSIYTSTQSNSQTDTGKISYDHKSTSAIRLNNGMVLYLRQVSDFLALVCIMNGEHFSKRSLLDYNIDVFRESLQELISSDRNRR